jgi:hypothetical protein
MRSSGIERLNTSNRLLGFLRITIACVVSGLF